MASVEISNLERLGVHGRMLTALQSLYEDSQVIYQFSGPEWTKCTVTDRIEAGLSSQPQFIWLVCRWVA